MSRRSAAQTDAAVVEAIRRAVVVALEEDLGPSGAGGDITTMSVVPAGRVGEAVVLLKADGVVCGMDAVVETFAAIDGGVEVETLVADGEAPGAGTVVASLRGRVRSILTGERTALNLVSHLSGIATLTRRFVEAAPGVVVTETRKTLPGLRALQKYAVTSGGGTNHRFALHDGVLIKDNHVVAAGGVGAAVRSARDALAAGRRTMAVQVECSTAEHVDEALAAGADRVLLDNVPPDRIGALVARARAASASVSIEATGGITLDNAAEFAKTGIDRISIGALTHSAPALDMSMDLRSAWDEPC